MSLSSLLRAHCGERETPASSDGRSSEEEATLEAMRHIFWDRTRRRERGAREEEGEGGGATAVIPRFYAGTPPQRPPSPHSSLLAEVQPQFRSVARARFLQRKEDELMDFQELTQLEEALSGAGAEFVNYDEFLALADVVSAKARIFFSARNFLAMKADASGRISTSDFFKHVYNSICLQKTRITLHYYDTGGRGFLGEQDLENYVFDLIPSMPSLASIPDNFSPFYVFSAVRRFMFFLDPGASRHISIETLCRSTIMDELQELGVAAAEEDADISKNWFSAANALRIYREYLELDEDRNGMLSRRELRAYSSVGSMQDPVQLTPFFVQRVFEEVVSYVMGDEHGEGELDYKTFLDFTLAMENKSSPQALAYFWKILDVNKLGYLDAATLRLFLRDISQYLEANGGDARIISHVTDEVFDMVKPKDRPDHITLRDFLDCGVGHTIITMLIDVQPYCEGAISADTMSN